MKLTVVTAVMSAIASGNRENLIRCVRSVAALKTPHEHLLYDGGSTDGTVELLRELEAEVNGVKKIGGENRWTADGLSSVVDAGPCPRQNEDATNPNERGQGPASTSGDESGALGDRALPEINNSTVPLFSTPIFSHPRLRVVSEPDTGIYNALNKGVRDARGDWFYVLGCDDFIAFPERLDAAIVFGIADDAAIVASPVLTSEDFTKQKNVEKRDAFSSIPYPHQGVIMRTERIRQYHGFDERYRIASDADLIWRMMLSNERVSLYHYPYTYYSMNGFSTGNAKLKEEMQTIVGCLHGLSRMEAERLLALRILPLRVCLRLLLKGSTLVSAAALFYLARWVANALGLIGDNGAIVFRR